MEVDGDNNNNNNQRRPARRSRELIEWTLEHHRAFLDIRSGLGDSIVDGVGITQSGVRILMVEIMCCPGMRGVPRSAIVSHLIGFEHLQDTTRYSLSSGRSGLMEGFKRLNINNNEELSSWTLEHHKRFVEAVVQLGGLGTANTTNILRLMEEKRRQGLTEQIVLRHLRGLRSLQRNSRENVSRFEHIRRIMKDS